MEIRRYGKITDDMPIPRLIETQQNFYGQFLQKDKLSHERADAGLEAIFREIFPITSYDESVSLEYLGYELGAPRHTPDECRALGLSYGAPLKIKVRFNREEPIEEDVYLGVVPLMIGGGEFIINGAERVIVTQIQRSPGCDFSEEVHHLGKRLHSCRIIPERGSWIQMEVTSKDILVIRIDRSAKVMATTFLRALSEDFSNDTDILRAFYKTQTVDVQKASDRTQILNAVLTHDVMDPDTGEIIAEARGRLTADLFDLLRNQGIGSIEIIPADEIHDELILNTLAEEGDSVTSHEDALLRIYSRQRPGNPPQLEKARTLFRDMFMDPKRYNFGRIGRFRLNRKFQHNVPEDNLTLTAADFYQIVNYILLLRRGAGDQVDIKVEVDDIDHLENRRVRTIKDLVMDEFRKGMIKLRRSVRERMSLKDIETSTPRTLINSQTVSSSIDYFFARGELSQVVDQSNPLSQLTHERRLSALGPGGLNRKRAGFEVRDVHPSHYGRICPIETPEGTNIGLIVSMAIYSTINELGFLVTPYRKVVKRKVTSKIVWLRADEEYGAYIAQADVPLDKNDRITRDRVVVRHGDDFTVAEANQVDLIDVSPKQLVGVAAALIPFLEHDDANRALMGSNMQRQAVPLLRPHIPLVGTGMEEVVARNSSMVVTSDLDGTVTYTDAKRITIKGRQDESTYLLRKYVGLNERTCLNQKPLVKVGDKVKRGQILTDGAATKDGYLALGRNVLVAFMSWEGTNFEDAILISEGLIRNDAFTSIHIEEFSIEIRETKLGREEITRDIPNLSEAALKNLDADGLVNVGTQVKPGDILVGKIAPKSKSELSSEEKLLHAIFGRAGEDVKNDSLDVKPGVEGYVMDVQRFRRSSLGDDEDRGEVRRQVKRIESEYTKRIAEIVRTKFKALKEVVGGRLINRDTGEIYRVSDADADADVIAIDQAMDLDQLDMHPSTRRKALATLRDAQGRQHILEVECERKVSKLKRGDDLLPGVLELVKVYVAVKRRLSVGDKMAGRHGNKGVVSRILPEEDMPFLEDGTPIEIVLNPLGVPSRMNLGQILETHLGWAAHELGFTAVTPVFDGATAADITKALAEASLPTDGKAVLYDGRTGESFDQKVTVGYIYMMKLHHLVAEKIHARATGPYSLITQQPLGGKARSGGQRFGEMEVWALEAYGAANVLQELLTVKSDDVDGRTKIYESLVKGENALEPGTPVSFEVLISEIKGLGLNIRLEKNTVGQA